MRRPRLPRSPGRAASRQARPRVARWPWLSSRARAFAKWRPCRWSPIGRSDRSVASRSTFRYSIRSLSCHVQREGTVRFPAGVRRERSLPRYSLHGVCLCLIRVRPSGVWHAPSQAAEEALQRRAYARSLGWSSAAEDCSLSHGRAGARSDCIAVATAIRGNCSRWATRGTDLGVSSQIDGGAPHPGKCIGTPHVLPV